VIEKQFALKRAIIIIEYPIYHMRCRIKSKNMEIGLKSLTLFKIILTKPSYFVLAIEHRMEKD
jgi:hypothetical protein